MVIGTLPKITEEESTRIRKVQLMKAISLITSSMEGDLRPGLKVPSMKAITLMGKSMDTVIIDGLTGQNTLVNGRITRSTDLASTHGQMAAVTMGIG